MSRLNRISSSAVGAAVITVSVLPLLLLGTSAAVPIVDSLDSQFVQAIILARHNLIAASGAAIVPDMLSGVPRGFFESPVSLYLWLFEIFPPFGALVANEILLRIVAFVGMTALMRHVLRHSEQGDLLIPTLTAAAFTALPFYSVAGGSVSGMPLFIWAALTVRDKGWGILPIAAALVYVCYAWLFVFAVFVLLALSAVFLIDLVRSRGAAWRLFQFLILASLLFVVREHQLFKLLLIDDVVVHRSEFAVLPVSMGTVIRIAIRTFVNGDYTASTLAVPVTLLALVGGGILGLKRAESFVGSRRATLIVAALVFVGATSLLTGLWNVFGTATLSRAYGIPYFNASRFFVLQPLAWFVAFGAALSLLRAYIRDRTVAILAVAGLASVQVAAATLRLPWYKGEVPGINAPYEQFFAPQLFAWVRGALPGTARVGVVGLHPSVAQFSRIPTIDGYLNIYPLGTKHRFGRIIASEVSRDADLNAYFFGWGNRAYLFSSEMGRAKLSHPEAGPPITLRYDMSAFVSTGGTHIISTRLIANADSLRLNCLGIFRSRIYPPLFVYAVSPEPRAANVAGSAPSCRDRGYAPGGG